MKARDAMVVWTPKGVWTDSDVRVKVVKWPPVNMLHRIHPMSYGACNTEFREASEVEQVARLFILFNTIVLRDGRDPFEVHHAFCEIDEYRENLSPELQNGESNG